MRRLVPLATAVLVLGAAGCGSTPATNGSGAAGTEGGKGPSAAVKPLTADEARRVAGDVDKRAGQESQDPEVIKGYAEGPWLDHLLAAAENGRKYGTGAPPEPTNSPEVAPGVHAWAGAGTGAGERWILAAGEVSSHTVGASQNAAEMRWSLHHEGKDGTWRAAFRAHAPTAGALPAPAVRPDGQAVTGGDTSKLAADPAEVCGRYFDYWNSKDGTDASDAGWGADIDAARVKMAEGRKRLPERLDNPKSLTTEQQPTRTPYGPLWRTADGGALVACLSVNTATVDMGPGRYQTFSSSGWSGTTGIRWSRYTQTQLSMTMLKIPAGPGEVSVGAEASWPYTFDGTRYDGG
ncbi:hypothetical protein ACFCV9_13085 [Streptomyces sp. NPDC056367]|uniref:hypothetical protein n=1 Tax=unclassified Streptomyces TaxID=2593676 RepID=UPI0035DC8FE3